MTKCIRCGDDSGYDRICYACHKKWLKRRQLVYNEAIAKYGPITAENLKDIQKYCKAREAELKREVPA